VASWSRKTVRSQISLSRKLTSLKHRLEVSAPRLPFHRTTVRRILLAAGLRTPRVRRPPHHRSRRDRMAREGVLLQADGSRHRWLGAKGPFWTLVGAIDDATGTVPAAEFREQEDAQGYLRVLHQVVRTKGIPLGIYVDHHGIFQRHGNGRPSLEAELRAMLSLQEPPAPTALPHRIAFNLTAISPISFNLANGQNGYSQSGASLGSTHSQQFRAGSSYNGGPGGIPYGYGPIPGSLTAAQGVLVQTNQHYHWLDHGSYF